MRKIRPIILIFALVVAACAQEANTASASHTTGELWQEPASGILTSTEKVPAGSRVYVAPLEGGFDYYIIAALHKLTIPVLIVTDRSKADFEISEVSQSELADWGRYLPLLEEGNDAVLLKMANLKTGRVVFAYLAPRIIRGTGRPGAGELCAQYVKQKVR